MGSGPLVFMPQRAVMGPHCQSFVMEQDSDTNFVSTPPGMAHQRILRYRPRKETPHHVRYCQVAVGSRYPQESTVSKGNDLLLFGCCTLDPRASNIQAVRSVGNRIVSQSQIPTTLVLFRRRRCFGNSIHGGRCISGSSKLHAAHSVWEVDVTFCRLHKSPEEPPSCSTR